MANRLISFGHEVRLLVDPSTPSRSTRWIYGHLSDAAVRIGERPGSSLVRGIERLPGRRSVPDQIDGLAHLSTPIPENAAERAIDSFRPDLVVGSSILRLSWRKIRVRCESRGIPTILYLRAQEAMNHFEADCPPADVIVANAESLASVISGRGVPCAFVPSVVETSTTSTNSARTHALAINPIESRGIGTVFEAASRLPDIRFIVQESWPLTSEQLQSLAGKIARLDNVEFRRAEPPGPQLYRVARTLLVPYRIDNRPRVIAEAQANGIPVVAGEVPALVEAIGEGGLRVPLDDIDRWCAALELLWNDDEQYEALSAAALTHSRRPEIDPEAVARSFEHIALDLLARGTGFDDEDSP